jgi:sodium transport system permease protein
VKARIGTVYGKEIKDAFRDRRTTLMVLLTSIVMGPATFFLVTQFMSAMEEKSTVRKVRIAGQEHAPALVNFMQRNDFAIEKAPADYEARIREGKLDAVIVVPEDFDDRYLGGDRPRVEIVYDDSRTESTPAIRQAERVLRAFNREVGMLRLIARGVSPDLAEPMKVEHVNTATPRQKGAMLLFIIPMFAVLAPLLGGMTLAIDSTAGERERGSLEPLLSNPVLTRDVVIGKWLAAWTTASLVATLTLAGFVVATGLNSEKRLAAFMTFGVPELAQFLLLLVPFAAMTAALQMLISVYGRSYREAQTYVGYLSSAVGIVPMVVLFAGMNDAAWQAAVPVLGQQMALLRVVRGDVLSWVDYVIPSGIAFGLAALFVALVARLLRDERIIFGRS